VHPDAIERVGKRSAGGGLRLDLVSGVFGTLVVVVEGLVLVAPVPHRRASVPTDPPNATAGKQVRRAVS
jgi:hypothetical protein